MKTLGKESCKKVLASFCKPYIKVSTASWADFMLGPIFDKLLHRDAFFLNWESCQGASRSSPSRLKIAALTKKLSSARRQLGEVRQLYFTHSASLLEISSLRGLTSIS
jgi:hypothetical protein